MKIPKVYFVLPCYNESLCLKETYESLRIKADILIQSKKIDKNSKVVFVDDGSKDDTWKMIAGLVDKDSIVVGLKLAHNVGHQNALLAGLMYAKDYCDVSISMDADLQDDLDVVDGFLKEYGKGNEIVYGVRGDRKTDTKFKRYTAQMFYKIMGHLGVELVYNAADCRLMSKKALDELSNYPEVNLFLRGMVPLIGLKSSTVEYERNKRIAGESKYPLKKMLSFAWDGVTSFSVRPIKMVLFFGFLVFILSLIIMIYALVVRAVGRVVDGWTFIVCSIWLVAGIQMISLGLIGEYIGKIYSETKRRPRFFVEEVRRR